MVTIRKISVCEFYDLRTYDKIYSSFEKQCNSNTKEYFAVINEDKILGHAVAILFPDVLTAQIIEIYVLPQERNQGLGDALLRTVFNYLRINFFAWVIITAHPGLENFLISKGLEEIEFQNLTEQITTVLEKNCVDRHYICNTEEFFKKKCTGNQLT